MINLARVKLTSGSRKTISRDDLEQSDNMSDKDIDYSDIPPLTNAQLASMKPLREVMMQQPALIINVSQLEGTCYFEFLPGEYKGECWNKHSVYLTEKHFAIIEGLVQSVVKGFDHYAFQKVDSPTTRQLVSVLRTGAGKVEEAESLTELKSILFLRNVSRLLEPKDVYNNKANVARMMRELSDWLEETNKTYETISVLGM